MEDIAVAICFVAGAWLLADFWSGFFHWWEDRYLTVDMPIIGPLVAGPNERHHSRPNFFITDTTYWYRNWTTIVPAAFIAAILGYYGQWFLCLSFVFLTQANEIHAFAHMNHNKLPWWILMLQEVGLFQSGKTHGKHHISPYAIRFCVMSEFLNPFLDRLRFWRGLEWIVEKQMGIKVKDVEATPA